MSKLLNWVMSNLEKNGYVNNENYEIVCYGLELKLMKTIISTGMLLLAVITGSFLEVIVFMAVYQPLRGSCGGYHAKTRISCILFSLGMLSLIICLTKILTDSLLMIVSLIFLFIGSGSIIFLAPVDTASKPFDEKERIVYRKRSFVILAIICCIYIACYLGDYHKIYFPVSYGIFMAGILLIIGYYDKRAENKM